MARIKPSERTVFDQLKLLSTEQVNPASRNLDALEIPQLVALINKEDGKVAAAVKKELPRIARAVRLVELAFRNGGRLIHVGAGTSGRLGVLDAAECPPTFGTPPTMVQAIMAGGNEAIFKSKEGAEDQPALGAKAIREARVTRNDVVCGIAASARTPFVLGAIAEARKRGAKTIFVTTNAPEVAKKLGVRADVIIAPRVGAEVLMGSTRMKSGTAQKMVLNMISTAAFVRMGKTYGNLMIDLQTTNIKLTERAKRIVSMVTGVDYTTAESTLIAAGGHVKTALVMIMAQIGADEARRRLTKAKGFLREAIV
jgi:N-acetylmuramic acid 6-phosphate etherase